MTHASGKVDPLGARDTSREVVAASDNRLLSNDGEHSFAAQSAGYPGPVSGLVHSVGGIMTPPDEARPMLAIDRLRAFSSHPNPTASIPTASVSPLAD